MINMFPSERKIVLRERAAGTYFSSAYFMAKVDSHLLSPLFRFLPVLTFYLTGMRGYSYTIVVANHLLMHSLLAYWAATRRTLNYSLPSQPIAHVSPSGLEVLYIHVLYGPVLSHCHLYCSVRLCGMLYASLTCISEVLILNYYRFVVRYPWRWRFCQ